MKRLYLVAAAALAASFVVPALAQNAPVQPVPPTPPMPPVAPGGLNRGPGGMAGPGGFRFQGMLGYQSNFTYMLLSSNKTELKLTDDQNTQIETTYRDSTKARTDGMQKQRKLNEEISALVEVDNPNMAAVEAKVKELATLQADSMLTDIKTNQKYKALLTPAQRAQLKTLNPRPPMPSGGFGMGGTRTPGVAPGLPGAPGVPGAPIPPAPPVLPVPPPPPAE